MAFKQLVHLHFYKHKSVDFYADRLLVSINYLNRCVTSVFRKSAKALILEVAIIHSQLLLLETNKSVASIAYELDFADPSYFARLFKKIVGMSPSDYRKSVRWYKMIYARFVLYIVQVLIVFFFMIIYFCFRWLLKFFVAEWSSGIILIKKELTWTQ